MGLVRFGCPRWLFNLTCFSICLLCPLFFSTVLPQLFLFVVKRLMMLRWSWFKLGTNWLSLKYWPCWILHLHENECRWWCVIDAMDWLSYTRYDLLWRGLYMVLWRGWCGTLKRVVWYFEDGGVVIWRGLLKRVAWYFKEGGVVLWRGLLKRVAWCFEECGVVLWRGLLKWVVWYFEEGGMVLWKGLLKRVAWYFGKGCWRGLCGTLKRVVWYFEEGAVVLWRGWVGTLKRVVWYFEESCMVLWRGWFEYVFMIIQLYPTTYSRKELTRLFTICCVRHPRVQFGISLLNNSRYILLYWYMHNLFYICQHLWLYSRVLLK